MKQLFILALIFASISARAQECEIVYGMRSDTYKPYEWVEDEEPVGMNIDLLKAIEKNTGCSSSIVIGGRAELLEMLQNGEITMLSMSPSSEVDEFAVYIQQAVVLNRYVVNRLEDPYINSMEDWRGKTILYVGSSYTDSYLNSVKDEYNLSILEYDTHDAMTQALVSGKGDFMITSLPVIMNLPESYQVKINGYPIIPTVYGFTLKKNSPLYPVINKAMEELKASGEYFDILKKWSRPQTVPIWNRYVLPALGIVGLLVVLVLLWNKSLHMRVQSKTASLKSLSQLLQMLLDVLPEQIYLLNKEGKPVWSNAASLEKAFSIDLIRNEIEHAIATGNSFEVKRLLDNAETWAVSGIIMEKEDEPLLLVASDITEIARQRDEALTADRMAALGNMAANIAHEINNPAGLIMHNVNFLQMLSKDIDNYVDQDAPDNMRFGGFRWQEAKTEAVYARQIIQENVQRIIDTVNDLKKFSKKRDDIYRTVDLKDCLNNSARFISYFVKSYTGNFSVHIDDSVPLIHGHEQHIEQVIINLIQNACYALTDSSQAIRCTLGPSKGGKYAVLTIADEGAGMDEATRRKAFDAFFTTRENGTGLGLSIVASIVKEHHGDYSVESEPSKGTTVTIFLRGIE